MLGIAFGVVVLLIEMLMPLSLAGIAFISKQNENGRTWGLAAETSASLLLVLGLGVATDLIHGSGITHAHAWVALFFAEAAACFAREPTVGPVTFRDVRSGQHGRLRLAIALGNRFNPIRFPIRHDASRCGRLGDRTVPQGFVDLWATALQHCRMDGKALHLLWRHGAVLLTGARLLTNETHGSGVVLLVAQISATVLALVLSTEQKWRRHFSVLAVLETVMLLLTIGALSTMNLAQRIELLTTAVGIMLTGAGLVGWRRESERRDPLVSCNLAIGSVLSTVPMLIGLIASHRLWLECVGLDHAPRTGGPGAWFDTVGNWNPLPYSLVDSDGDVEFGHLCAEPGVARPLARPIADDSRLHDGGWRSLLRDRGAAECLSRSVAGFVTASQIAGRRVPSVHVALVSGESAAHE